MIDKKQMGKTSRKQGKAFEVRVRAHLEKQGWIVSKWGNNISFKEMPGKLVPAKGQYNPFFKKIVGEGSGFPDFMIFRREAESVLKVPGYIVIGVESKMTGILTREEKQKCFWLLAHNIFSQIYIAMKGNKRGEILMKRFNHEKV